MPDRKLYEIDHPYYGAEGFGEYGYQEFMDVDELIRTTNGYDEDMNHVYRWDWEPCDDSQPGFGRLTLFVILQRKSRIVNWSAPVTPTDEPKVRAFLSSDRILGALRRLWEPLLDVPETKSELYPGRWWRVLDPNGNLWAETSNEAEARARVRAGDKLQRNYSRIDAEWRDVE
jgi:hypothetical protein